MSERLFPISITRRAGRLDMALLESDIATDQKQSDLTIRTLQEIRTTGECREYGKIFSSLDALLAIPLRKQRVEDKHKIVSTAKILRDAFGKNRITEVYSVWKSFQIPESE